MQFSCDIIENIKLKERTNMKSIFEKLTAMVYPMLISLFLLIYTEVNVTTDLYEPMLIVTVFLTLLFAGMFLVGLLGTLFAGSKERK